MQKSDKDFEMKDYDYIGLIFKVSIKDKVYYCIYQASDGLYLFQQGMQLK